MLQYVGHLTQRLGAIPVSVNCSHAYKSLWSCFFTRTAIILFLNMFSCQVCLTLVFTWYSYLFGYATNMQMFSFVKTPQQKLVASVDGNCHSIGYVFIQTL